MLYDGMLYLLQAVCGSHAFFLSSVSIICMSILCSPVSYNFYISFISKNALTRGMPSSFLFYHLLC